MANARVGNKLFVDTTGSVVDSPNTKITYILFTPSAAFDSLTLRETASGPDCLFIQAATAKDTKLFDLSRKPMLFVNGIFVQAITSGAKAVIITSLSGE